MKSFLLSKLVESSNRAERLAIASTIASVAKFSFIKNQGWNELLVMLDTICKQEQNIELKEVGFILWRNIIIYCGGSLKKHFGNILKILQQGLKDKSSNQVRIESVKCIGEMVEFLETQEEVDIIANIIPEMVEVIDQCLKEADEENVISGMEVFNNLIECKIPVLFKHSVDLTKFNIKIASAKNELPMTVRKQATNFCTWMCKSKPKTVMKHRFVPPFLTLCINLIMESEEMENELRKTSDDESEDDEKTQFLSPLGIACDLLDEIFLNIPSEQCFPITVKAIEQLLKDETPKRRRSAYIIISMMAEGCKEIISRGENLSLLLNACLKGTTDEYAIVRKCSLEAISQMATHLNVEIIDYHAIILPACFKIFANENEEISVKERALTAIEMFIDAYDADKDEEDDINNNNNQSSNIFKIGDYLSDIMNTVANCLESNSLVLQQQALATINSCSTAAKQKFNIYIPRVLQILDVILQEEDKEKIELRAIATLCLGSIALNIGYDEYMPMFHKYHDYVMDGLLAIDDSALREASFTYFSDIAELMGIKLLELDTFEDMLNYVFFIIEDDDGLIVELPDDGFGDAVPSTMIQAENAMAEALYAAEDIKLQDMTDEQFEAMILQARNGEINDENGFLADILSMVGTDDDFKEIDDDDESSEDEQDMIQLRNVRMAVTTGFMEEKAAAIQALTYFIKNCGFGFLQYIDQCWERLIALWEYPHSLVKMAVSNCFHEFFTLIVNYSLLDEQQCEFNEDKNRMYPWRKNISIEYSDYIKSWILKIFPLYIQAIRDEDDRDALAIVIEYFIEQLRVLGPASIASMMDELISVLILFLDEKCVCQQSTDPENRETKDIATKHKWVSDTIAEFIAVLAELFYDQFDDIFNKLFQHLFQFGRDTRHAHDQSMMIGCIGDCCSRLYYTNRERNTNESCHLMSPFSDVIFQRALNIAQSQDTNMRQNALYCMGAMFMVCDQSSNMQHSQSILNCIKIYMQCDRNGDRSLRLVRDNAVSALGKIIISEPQRLPVRDLLPLFLNALPLTADVTENQYVYDVVMRFVLNERELIQPYIQQALELCAFAVDDKDVPGEITGRLIAMFQQILCDEQSQIRQIIPLLSQKSQSVIRKISTT